ncbi:OLC1v1010710C1 [Oldenlandia corymbosa var. corymbosa]|uniref:OLC1v1010710C1 n=1 Tax=Oldenlandia corymbosa var. corymbosa TaxID=529605 RepID=A0AAV1DUB6_OLDCO|nr:OLC1v1010710C1 [Oldenlandia corymbosa var. corymbosa]
MAAERSPSDDTKGLSSTAAQTQVMTSCRKKKNESATFLEDVKDHIDEFIHASMDEHKTCFQKTIKKVFFFLQTTLPSFISLSKCVHLLVCLSHFC